LRTQALEKVADVWFGICGCIDELIERILGFNPLSNKGRAVVLIIKSLSVAVVFAGAIAPSHAQNTDALWDKVVVQLDAAHRWVAGDFDLSSDVDTGSEVKHISTTMRLSAWKEGQPLYEQVKAQPPDSGNGPRKDFKFLNALTSLADALKDGDAPHRINGQSLTGVPCVLFETHFDKALQTGAVKLWVDPQSGAPRQMVVTVHMPLMLDATITTRYVAGPEGSVMPANVEYALEVLVPFKKSKVHMEQITTSWVARPLVVSKD